MSIIEIIILAIGLSMDAVAVSISSSLAVKEIKFSHGLKMGAFFGGFQALMPFIGWLAGVSFRKLIQGLDHWIAFLLLAAIGGKMIYEGCHEKDCETPKNNPFQFYVLLGLAIATSIDALAAGVSFAVLDLNILFVVTIIGTITFTLSCLAVELGKKLGCHFGSRMEITGGVILVAIGAKILIEHLTGKI